MNWKSIQNLLTDQRAVSPVLGVALLIAITVILAGVIGFVVLGVQAGNADGPSASLEFEQSGADGAKIVSMTHKGGDPITGENLQVKVVDADDSDTNEIAGKDLGAITGTINTGVSKEVATGATSGDTVRVVWNDPNSDREVLLAEYTVE